jgi:hypothetical protein
MQSVLSFLRPAAIAAGLAMGSSAPALGQDADEADLLKRFEKVDVWHFPVDYAVGYNNQDVVVTRELVAVPPPAGKLCYIRFDVTEAEGDYAYGFKPQNLPGPRSATAWGVYVHNRGTVLNQLRSILRLDAVYFYVEGPKDGENATDVCAQKQAAGTPAAGAAYKAPEWSDLIVRAKLLHGWPKSATQ